jgi:hypothetical protein
LKREPNKALHRFRREQCLPSLIASISQHSALHLPGKMSDEREQAAEQSKKRLKEAEEEDDDDDEEDDDDDDDDEDDDEEEEEDSRRGRSKSKRSKPSGLFAVSPNRDR